MEVMRQPAGGDLQSGAAAVPGATTPAAADGPPVSAVPVRLCVNGQWRTLALQPWVTLLDLLRDKLDLIGSKKGCDHGQCGACTVLVDGRRVNACLALAVMQDEREITTVEGLADGSRPAPAGGAAAGADADPHAALHPLQRAFIEHDALQCGYCTPGQLCSAVGLLHEGHARNLAQVRELMSGNICRCGAYPQIAAAVAQVVLVPRAVASPSA
jgi:xanthine dehydrogenase YagT iron-sulfur-binding subunit